MYVCISALLCFLVAIVFLASGNSGIAKTPPVLASQIGRSPVGIKKTSKQDDSFNLKPAADLVLHPEGERKAGALADFVEGMAFEENGETDRALEAYRKVLNVDPGQSDLAARVAALLIRQDDFPQAIDVLKDAIKANPNDAEPYRQLAFIYAKYLKKTDQAVEYANRAIALDPRDIEAYQRLCEIELAAGEEKKALEVLERATKAHSDDATFWTRLGKLYAAILFKPDSQPKPDELRRVNEVFKKAAEHADDDPSVLKDVADYYAASQQLKEAIPLYLRALELQPDDANAREKLASSFILTNQRPKAVEMLEQLIKQHPEKYQPYDLLAQILDDEARSLQRAKRVDEAKAKFAKVAANYEQSLLINPNHAGTYLRLAELLLGPIKDADRAVKILIEARRRFPGALQIEPDNGSYLDSLGWVEFRKGRFDQALADLLRAAKNMEHEDAIVFEHIGDVYLKLNRVPQALEAWQKALVLDPKNKTLTEKIESTKTTISKGSPAKTNPTQ